MDYHWRREVKAVTRLSNIHPGEVIREDFMAPVGMTAHQLANGLRMQQTAVSQIRAAMARSQLDRCEQVIRPHRAAGMPCRRAAALQGYETALFQFGSFGVLWIGSDQA